MKHSILIVTSLLCVANSWAQVKKSGTNKSVAVKKASIPVNLCKDNRDSASYSIGVRIAQNLKSQGFESINLNLLQKAFSDVLQSKSLVIDGSSLDESISKFQQKAAGEKSAANKRVGKLFLTNNAKRAGVLTLPGGVQYEVLKTGTGTIKPLVTDTIRVHYHGTLIDGTVFDSSVDRGEPIVYQLGGLIKGWQDALQQMTVGSKWKLYIPSDLAYGDRSPGATIPGGSTLVFEVELLGIGK